MDVVNLVQSRRFLRERPVRVRIFDRPRLVCEVLCLEPMQTENRRGIAASDSLYLVTEGRARLRTGTQIEELQEQDVALVPPGVDHTIENPGGGRLTLMVIIAPKPSRAGEVRLPPEERPRGARPEPRRGPGAGRAEEGDKRRARPGRPPPGAAEGRGAGGGRRGAGQAPRRETPRRGGSPPRRNERRGQGQSGPRT